MNMKRFLFSITIFLLHSSLIFSQEMNQSQIERKNNDFEARIRSEERSSIALQKQSDSLAVMIQQMKADDSLNIFERQKLERLLKESQEIGFRVQAMQQALAKTRQDYQIFLRESIAWFDVEIQQLLLSIEIKRVGSEEKQKKVDDLLKIKKQRKEYSQKLEPQLIPALISNSVEIADFDNYEQIIRKADLVKDQEEKTRRQLAALKLHVKEAQNELNLRSKMNELISDTYLMEHQSETFLSTARAEDGRMTDANEGVYNSKLSPEEEILVTVFDDYFKFDVSEISNMDLEFYLKNLKTMISKMVLSADSLQMKAEKFYRAAEVKREGSKK